jgi:hypothetical protein
VIAKHGRRVCEAGGAGPLFQTEEKTGIPFVQESCGTAPRMREPGQIVFVQHQVAVRFEPEALGGMLAPQGVGHGVGPRLAQKGPGIGVFRSPCHALVNGLAGRLFSAILGEGRRVDG